jgi:phosphoribosyl 1,2-cyclic phosphodiesterase
MGMTNRLITRDFIYTVGSGSSGNSAILSFGGKLFIHDFGVSTARVRKALNNLGYGFDDVSAVLITHDHSDHISGLRTLCKYYDLPIVASGPTIEGVVKTLKRPFDHFYEIKQKDELRIGDIAISSYPSSHDAKGSINFIFKAGNKKFSCITDSGYISEDIGKAALGSDLLMIESNHDEQMLKDGPYPPYLKKRIAGNKGHLSNRQCSEYLIDSIKNGTTIVLLAHLSQHNNTPAIAYKTNYKLIRDNGLDAKLVTAPVLEMAEAIYF